MNGLDLLLLAIAGVACVGGWRLGLVARALGWVGAVFGLAVAVGIVPAVVRTVEPSSDLAVVLLGGGCLVLLASAGQAIGVAIGSNLRPEPNHRLVHRLDAAGGAVLGVVGVAVILWLLLPLMSSAAGGLASATRNSTLARAVGEVLPDPPAQVTDLERELAGGAFPRLFTGIDPTPELPEQPTGGAVPAEVLRAVEPSTARVRGRACDLVQSGSAFSVGEGLWVTNAHVVAGTTEVELTAPDGAGGRGRVVAFDPDVDLALVRSDLARPALAIAEAREGLEGTALGYPGGGPLELSPFVVAEARSATGYDIYDRDLVRRDLLVLAAELEPGDSGSALVDPQGRVVGVSVAVAPDRAGVAYALAPEELGDLLDTAEAPVDTGGCLR